MWNSKELVSLRNSKRINPKGDLMLQPMMGLDFDAPINESANSLTCSGLVLGLGTCP